MNKKQLITSIIIGIVGFVLGYWAKTLNSEKTTISITQAIGEEQKNPVDETQDIATQESTTNEEINYAKLLKGKYILRGADWAGFEFMKGNRATWTNELFPNDPDTMRINWINNNTFVATFISGLTEDCPPNVWIKQVVSLEGKKLKLQEINTSWVDLEQDVLTFVKE
jgi:hypothetical protein